MEDNSHKGGRKLRESSRAVKHLNTAEIAEFLAESDDELFLDNSDEDPDYEDGDSESDGEDGDHTPEHLDIVDDHQIENQQTVQNTVQPNLRDEIWFSEKDNSHSVGVPEFLGSHKVNFVGDVPLDYFLKLFSIDLLEEITFQTNLYALQKGKENLALSISELKIFLGVALVMSYIKYPRIRQYWSQQAGLRMDLIADAISVNRFEEIRQYLHFIDSNSIPANNTDKAIRVRPILDKLHENFHAAVDAEECHSVDEMMIPFKGRSSLKQYLPRKPKRWGYKMWVRAGISGYVYCFELYQGASGGRADITDCGAVGDVVLRLCHDLHGKNHKVYADNLFSSIPLVKKLRDSEIWYVGTMRINRMKNADRKLKSHKDLKQEGRGSSSQVTSNNDVTITRWLDNSLVHVVSSYAGKTPESETERFSRKEKRRVPIKRPFSVDLYNKHMGGVDLMDSLVALYRNDVRNKRWYMRIFYHMLNVTVVNGWILWKWNDHQKMDLLEFKSRVASGLIYTGLAELNRKKRGRPSLEEQTPAPVKKRVTNSVPLELRFDGGSHFPKKTEGKFANRCRDKHCQSKTRYECNTCKVPVCPECMLSFHTK
ncbi:piggyBac transposable element-derived protein 3 [Nilaparvata lugens]|uniref:piggyBac transposable element-derived protein 3 n=1 Tax=Nilaparvata lugens TaxID=108931 RepID=UPI00193E288D|nr:piggyBac transposable element-derived protein 3 [Nilaparvata lugens]